jgi:hypothetical protein
MTTPSANNYQASGISLNFSAGDWIDLKIITPSWVTNPLGVYCACTIWFVRRS